MVYNVKLDLTHKARLFFDGSRVDPRGLSTRAIVVKGVYVRLLEIVSDSQKFKVVTGDISNVFIQTYTKGKIYTTC